MKTKTYMRYHRYDKNNTKYIKRFEINDVVPSVADEGFTEWRRGTGPHTIETYNKVASGIRRACLGVPKPPEQREKMRLAKLGVPKTEEHKENMRLSWQRRRDKQLSIQMNEEA